ncbi:hypothetical protein DOT_1156 [Desulfosporosinus sp. OT]|nr:hypothetical protein DOT_1156 [Desulfosporosinus sp. OT]
MPQQREGWRRVVFVGPDGELIEFRGYLQTDADYCLHIM